MNEKYNELIINSLYNMVFACIVTGILSALKANEFVVTSWRENLVYKNQNKIMLQHELFSWQINSCKKPRK